MIYLPNPPLKFDSESQIRAKIFYYTQSPKSGAEKYMNLQSAAITGSANPTVKIRSESEIRGKKL